MRLGCAPDLCAEGRLRDKPSAVVLTGLGAGKTIKAMSFDKGRRGDRGGRGRDKRDGFGEDNFSPSYGDRGGFGGGDRAPYGGGGGGGYGGGGGGGYDRPRREMFPATCSQCGKETQVPFQPRGDKPVYCSDCFSKQRGGGGGYSRSYR